MCAQDLDDSDEQKEKKQGKPAMQRMLDLDSIQPEALEKWSCSSEASVVECNCLGYWRRKHMSERNLCDDGKQLSDGMKTTAQGQTHKQPPKDAIVDSAKVMVEFWLVGEDNRRRRAPTARRPKPATNTESTGIVRCTSRTLKQSVLLDPGEHWERYREYIREMVTH